MPIGGIIAGTLILDRRPGHGVTMFVLSMLWSAAALFFALLLIDAMA